MVADHLGKGIHAAVSVEKRSVDGKEAVLELELEEYPGEERYFSKPELAVVASS